jgi:ornithine cyclodeaminase
MGEPRWISEQEVCRSLDMAAAIEALRAGLRLEAAGGAANMVKTHVAWERSTLHAIGAVMPEAGLVGSKTWAHTPGGATPLEIVWDAGTGALVAVIEAFALGQLRTGGISGLATDLLADPAADELALCGTGKQALAQVAAVAAVRTLGRVRVFGRDAARRAAFVASVQDRLGLRTEEFDSAEAAVRDAPIVTLVTRATAPFLKTDAVVRGAHVNAVGAITPERAEFEPDLLARCAVIAADSSEQALRLSSEFREFFAQDGGSKVCSLASLIDAPRARPAGADLTLFKAMGMGISDLSLARAVLERGAAGRALPAPQRATLRLLATEEPVSDE